MGRFDDSISGAKETIGDGLSKAVYIFSRNTNSDEESQRKKILDSLRVIDKLYGMGEHLSNVEERINELGNIVAVSEFRESKKLQG